MDTSKTIKRSELQKADILLFPPNKNSIVSVLISIITDSPVTHATMYYGNNQIIQETLPCADVDELTDELINKYAISVMRLDPKVDSMDKVLARAKYYVDEKTPFALLDLVPIGVFILLKREAISLGLKPLLILLMKKVIAKIISYINSKEYPDSKPMTCSQFVYDCYREAGKEYALKINNAYSSQNILKAIQEYIEQNKSSLKSKLIFDVDKLVSDTDDIRNTDMDMDMDTDADMDTDTLLKEIYIELNNNQNNETNCTIDDEFAIITHKFCSVVMHFFHNPENSILSETVNPVDGLESLFVSPGDLLENCDNLSFQGIVTIN